MKSEALDALTTQTMRPKALDAVAAQKEGERSPDKRSPARQQIQVIEEPATASKTFESSAPASDGSVATTDGSTEDTPTTPVPTATTIVSEVAQSVKSAVDTAIAWAETKAESLSAEHDSTGPYASPATCMPSDLDAIASGILPAMPIARQYDGSVDDEKKEAKGTEKSTKTGDG
ncbi:hypothetical protein AA0119_g663 [Alternaria tenuissima]|uniref:Uncharacterized protein n=2 Tax=Alternaria alternata complex TaxID=187734 RepID=A0A4Q4NCB5_ALTAL|nr:hypothetical protein AA0115_g874 [Alternaria tenuissima]RYN72696.1 hypothetical protein AA0117_g8302 [Alternaria alternata]RYO09434.1 hypothetical protein AA0119_g663 [Alternaria tenuissima]RYO11916.1 hypothetical protein AA0121_g9624 [Alternaria tenuissima]RYO54069.1 hypothetical protein AA0116_g10682 [Alternaria tenuissima]